MKNLLKLLALASLFSCTVKEEGSSGNILENLSYSVDTVVVDPGEDMFILSRGINIKALNANKSRLFYFESEPLNLVEVDLNNLRLISKSPFQTEGPNGIGTQGVRFQIGSDGNLFIKSFLTQGIFNTRGELIESLKVVPEGVDTELANNLHQLYENTVFDFENNRIYSQPSSEALGKHELYIIDPVTKHLRIDPVPEMKAAKEFLGTMVVNGMIDFFWVDSDMYIENQQLFLTVGSMSGIYRFDPKKDSLEFVDIQHENFPNRMPFTVNNSPVDEDVFNEDKKKVFEHLNYMEPRWDGTREMFLRLGRKKFLAEKSGDPSTFEVFLFAYDKDFNVLGETKIEDLDQVPSSYFWKDGKLWSYVNVEDELGFAVIDFKF